MVPALPEDGALPAGGMLDGAAMPDPDGEDMPDPDGADMPDPDGAAMPDPDGADMPDPDGADMPVPGAVLEDGVVIGMVLSPVADALPPRAAARLFAFNSSVDGSPARFERVFGPCMWSMRLEW